ncbi:hypothetical protein SNEBB_003101, partial [Seison nebaliae]
TVAPCFENARFTLSIINEPPDDNLFRRLFISDLSLNLGIQVETDTTTPKMIPNTIPPIAKAVGRHTGTSVVYDRTT